MRRQAGAAIDHEDHGIGFGNRLLGLAGHFMEDALLDQGFKAAGINYQIGLFSEFTVTVVTVAGQARHICDDGIARFRQAVKKRGFADVGTTDEDQGGLHCASMAVRVPPVVWTKKPLPKG